jgi:hypothetical protein
MDPRRFLEALHNARQNEEISIGTLIKTLTLESWLRHLTIQGVLTNSMATKRLGYSSVLDAKQLSEPAQPKSSAS